MRFRSIRRLTLAAVPVAVTVCALGLTAAPATALTCGDTYSAAIQQAELTADGYVLAQEWAIDDGDYDLANYAYIEAGKWFTYADYLRVRAAGAVC